MIKLLDLEKEELKDFAETLESFSELDGTLYLANNEDDYTRVYRLDNDKRILIDESLRHNFYNTNTYVMFARNSDNLWYSRLNKTDKGYCYTVKNVKNDVINAGAEFKDESVVVDRNLVSSRTPDDLDDFNREIKNQLK